MSLHSAPLVGLLAQRLIIWKPQGTVVVHRSVAFLALEYHQNCLDLYPELTSWEQQTFINPMIIICDIIYQNHHMILTCSSTFYIH